MGEIAGVKNECRRLGRPSISGRRGVHLDADILLQLREEIELGIGNGVGDARDFLHFLTACHRIAGAENPVGLDDEILVLGHVQEGFAV